MKVYVQWEDRGPFIAHGGEFLNPTKIKEKAIATFRKYKRQVEVRQGNHALAEVYYTHNGTPTFFSVLGDKHPI